MGLKEERGARCGKTNVIFNKLTMLPEAHSVATRSWDGHSDSTPPAISDGHIYLFPLSLSVSTLMEFIILTTEIR